MKEKNRKILRENSKSFNWASKLFSKEKRDLIGQLYFFCRTLDDIADEKYKDNLDILREFKELITDGQQQNVRENHVGELYQAYQGLNLNKEVLIHLLDGLISDQQTVEIKNERELIIYCYRVAGTVGLFMCPILGCQKKEAYKFAVDLGVGMQLTNIARDVYEDSSLERRYLPESWLGSMTTREIREASLTPGSESYKRIRNATHKLLDLAQAYYSSGRLGLFYLPQSSKLGVAAAANIYESIGEKIRSRDFDWGQKRAYTTTIDKIFATLISTKNLINFKQKPPIHSTFLHYHLQDFKNSW